VPHGSEIPFVFHQTEQLDADSARLADVITTYWANFATTGDPNNAGSSRTAQAVPTTWPAYAGVGGTMLKMVAWNDITVVS
jgi:carboxylesterase type B